jgi:hypothetical protein
MSLFCWYFEGVIPLLFFPGDDFADIGTHSSKAQYPMN